MPDRSVTDRDAPASSLRPPQGQPAGETDMSGTQHLPKHLAEVGGWVEIPGLGWLHEERPGFWWWHDCEPLRGKPEWSSLRSIDTTTGERHAITSGSLSGGDLTIHGGSGSIPCDECGLHGWVRDGKWVTA